MNLNTNILLGKGRLFWLDATRKHEIGIWTDGQRYPMHQFNQYAGWIGHLFIRRFEGARSSLGNGRILFTQYGVKLRRVGLYQGSALFVPHVEELVITDTRPSPPVVELYFYPRERDEQ